MILMLVNCPIDISFNVYYFIQDLILFIYLFTTLFSIILNVKGPTIRGLAR